MGEDWVDIKNGLPNEEKPVWLIVRPRVVATVMHIPFLLADGEWREWGTYMKLRNPDSIVAWKYYEVRPLHWAVCRLIMQPPKDPDLNRILIGLVIMVIVTSPLWGYLLLLWLNGGRPVW